MWGSANDAPSHVIRVELAFAKQSLPLRMARVRNGLRKIKKCRLDRGIQYSPENVKRHSASESHVSPPTTIFEGLGSCGHRSRGELIFQFWRAPQCQTAQVAADYEAASEGDYGYEKQREPPLRLNHSLHGSSRALSAGALRLSDCLGFIPDTK